MESDESKIYMETFSMLRLKTEYDEGDRVKIDTCWNALTKDKQEEFQFLHTHIITHLNYLKQAKQKFESQKPSQYQTPLQMIHSNRVKTSPTVNMGYEASLQILFQPKNMSFLIPKRAFLLYGLDGSGKSQAVDHIFANLSHYQCLLHLKEELRTWNMTYFKDRWQHLIQHIKELCGSNQCGIVLLELEHLELIPHITPNLLEPFLQLERVIVVGETNRPDLCNMAFNNSMSLRLFIDNPDAQAIYDMIHMNFLQFVHDPEHLVAKNKFPFANTLAQLKRTFRSISQQLSCNSQQTNYNTSSAKYKTLRFSRAESQTKLQDGITLSTLHSLLLPRFLGAIAKLRRHWYQDQCIPTLVNSGRCTDEDVPTLTKEVIENTHPSTLQDVRIMNPHATCELLSQATLCQEQVFVDWPFIEKAKEQIIVLANEILLDVSEKEMDHQIYVGLVKHYLSD